MLMHPLFSLVAPPIWGTLADTLQARLPLLRLAGLGCAVAILFWLPTWSLWGHLLCMCGLAFFRAPLVPLADATTYSVMGGRRVDYSSVRVWGSIGFAACVLFIGVVHGSEHLVFLLTFASGVHLLSSVVTLPMQRPPFIRLGGVLKGAMAHIQQWPMVCLLLANALYYSGHSAHDIYFSLYVKQLGYGDAFLGLAWSIAVTAEICLMLLAPRFIHRIKSASMLCLCSLVASLRWEMTSLLSAKSALLLIQPLHAVSFGLWYLSLVKYVQSRAPENLRTTMQSVAAASVSLGMVIGYSVGGSMMHYFGGAALYQAASMVALASLGFYLLTRLKH